MRLRWIGPAEDGPLNTGGRTNSTMTVRCALLGRCTCFVRACQLGVQGAERFAVLVADKLMECAEGGTVVLAVDSSLTGYDYWTADTAWKTWEPNGGVRWVPFACDLRVPVCSPAGGSDRDIAAALTVGAEGGA